jgi:aspartate-semialdehyde dehydrogenase
LYKAFGIKRLIASTYQAVSGAGAAAMEELEEQTRQILNGEPITPKEFPHQIAFNLFSHNSDVGENGYNEEEQKMLREMRKIFHDDTLMISTTCVRVPVFRTHVEALHIELEKEATPEAVRELLRSAPGIAIVDDTENSHFPMPIEAAEQYDVLVGRIRRDTAFTPGIAMLVAGDQLLKGAALNAVQIAELLVTG